MTTTLIAAIAAGIAVVVSAVFTGLAQLQHSRSQHGPGDQSQAGGQSSQPPPPGGSH